MENQSLFKDCKQHEICIVKSFNCMDIKKYKRLCELGFIAGEKIQFFKKNKDGSGLIILRGCVFSIDKTLAESIIVLRGNYACKK